VTQKNIQNREKVVFQKHGLQKKQESQPKQKPQLKQELLLNREIPSLVVAPQSSSEDTSAQGRRLWPGKISFAVPLKIVILTLVLFLSRGTCAVYVCSEIGSPKAIKIPIVWNSSCVLKETFLPKISLPIDVTVIHLFPRYSL